MMRAMGIEEVLAAVSGAAFLGIALLMARLRTSGNLTTALGLMSVLLAGYCFADVADDLYAHPAWRWIEYAFASWASAALIAVLAGFLGLRREFSARMRVLYIYFAALGVLCLLSFSGGALSSFAGSAIWAGAMLLGLAPSMLWLGSRLIAHLRGSPEQERARTLVLLIATAFGIGGVTVDLLALTGAPVPRLASLGLVIATAVLALLIVRSGLFTGITRSVLLVAGLFSLGVLAALFVFTRAPKSGLLSWLLPSLWFAGLFFAVLLPVARAVLEKRARQQQLLTTGALADQMTHDLLNPLAAIRGAAQLLLESQRTGSPVDSKYLDLIVAKSGQLERSIRGFERMGRVQLDAMSEIQLGELLTAFVEAQRAVFGSDITVRLDVQEPLPELKLDADLITVAFENLAQNVRQAMPSGGTLDICTGLIETPLGRRVRITFTDDGPGMDVRALELAFDAGFTTKRTGRGLGLPYVREVIQGHGGRVTASSRSGGGTTFRVDLPA